MYRHFEPLIESLAISLRKGDARSLAKLQRNLGLSNNPLPWSPEEFLGSKYVEAVCVALVILVLFAIVTESFAIGTMAAIGILFVYVPMARNQVQSLAGTRLQAIRRRLPFVMDLTALTMQAGASFLEAMKIAKQENRNHPLGEQLAIVLRDMDVGRSRREALEALQARLSDDDVTEIVFSIIKGEELGTPLAQILQNQADQMRLKRSQWAERAAAEAQVNIVFPGLIVMVACLLIVVAPFVLDATFVQQ